MFFIYRPLPFDDFQGRSTDADGHRPFASATRLRTKLRPGRLAEAKRPIASRYKFRFCLGRACPVVAERRSRIAKAKFFYCLRIVCVRLR